MLIVETKEAALHEKPQSGHACTAAMADNIHEVDKLIHNSDYLTTDNLCSTLSTGKGSY
jgi:hypothetical protein